MSLTLIDIQRITIEGLKRIHAEYAPAYKRYALSATPEPEYDGHFDRDKDLFICAAVMTFDQFQEMRDYCNGLGVWLTAHWKPFGRTINKFYYDLAATRLIERAEWTKRRADNTVRCTIELIGEDARNPTMGIVEVVRQLADQLEAKARLNGHAPLKYQLVVEGDLTRGRATVRRQSDRDPQGFATEVIAVPGTPEPPPAPAPQPVATIATEVASPPPAPPPAFIRRPYGTGSLVGWIVEVA